MMSDNLLSVAIHQYEPNHAHFDNETDGKQMKRQLFGLCSLYFIGTVAAQYAIFELRQRHCMHEWCLLMMPCAAFMDALIAVIVMQNLEVTLAELQMNGQSVKYAHYRKFSIALLVLLMFAMANTIVQSFIMRREHWFHYFDLHELVHSCFWHFSMILFVSIVQFLWRPTKDAKNYAFFKQITQNERGHDADFDTHGQVVRMGGNGVDVLRDLDDIFKIEDIDDPDIGSGDDGNNTATTTKPKTKYAMDSTLFSIDGDDISEELNWSESE